MTPLQKRRLSFVALLVGAIGIAVALTLAALDENINLFFTPQQVTNGEAPTGANFRIGGLVEEGSVSRGEGLIVNFAISDNVNRIPVSYDGILPDLFREGQGIVVLGQLDQQGVVVASEVLAKHDETYMPPEAMEAMRQAKEAQQGS
ncbi:cytochrome c maturation protein CcmE [Gammaproteobacteria bacterium]|nr:cytochrome c maturation protein CcmE [Gammaproteobacteria bacterium]